MMRCMRMHVLEQWEIFHNIRMHLPAKNIHCKIKMQRDIHLYSPLIFNSGKLQSRFPLIRLQIYFHFTPSPETPPLNFHRNLIRPFVLPRRTSKLWERSASMMKRNTNAKCQRNFDSPFVQKYYTQLCVFFMLHRVLWSEHDERKIRQRKRCYKYAWSFVHLGKKNHCIIWCILCILYIRRNWREERIFFCTFW